MREFGLAILGNPFLRRELYFYLILNVFVRDLNLLVLWRLLQVLLYVAIR